MKMILPFIILLTASAFGATKTSYQLNVKYSLDEVNFTSGKLWLKEGQKGTVKGQKTFLEVVPSDGKILDRDGVLLTFNVGTIDKDGNKKILSRPQMLVNEDTDAEISIDDVTVAVKVDRKKL